jgi:hypothetical protein
MVSHDVTKNTRHKRKSGKWNASEPAAGDSGGGTLRAAAASEQRSGPCVAGRRSALASATLQPFRSFMDKSRVAAVHSAASAVEKKVRSLGGARAVSRATLLGNLGWALSGN